MKRGWQLRDKRGGCEVSKKRGRKGFQGAKKKLSGEKRKERKEERKKGKREKK